MCFDKGSVSLSDSGSSLTLTSCLAPGAAEAKKLNPFDAGSVDFGSSALACSAVVPKMLGALGSASFGLGSSIFVSFAKKLKTFEPVASAFGFSASGLAKVNAGEDFVASG